MISSTDRARIDAAIDASLERLSYRAQSHGDGARALTAAIESATHGGKRLRPHLVVAAYRACVAPAPGAEVLDPTIYRIAAAFELLHSAFVIHDDVIDHDTVRRGVPNVAGQFRGRGHARGASTQGSALLGDAAAILAGDLLLHEATRTIARAAQTDSQRESLLDLLDDAVFVTAAGELADVENSVSADLGDPDDILSATFNKTAVYSFTAPLCAGAVLADAPSSWLAEITKIAGSLGFAFQLVDDLIGAFGSSEQAGKDAGSDLREAKRTPLIALAQESTHWPVVTDALAVAHTGPIAIREAQTALEASGARLRLTAIINDHLEQARDTAAYSTLPSGMITLTGALAQAVEERIP